MKKFIEKFIEKLTRADNIVFGIGILCGIIITAESFKSGFISIAICSGILSIVALIEAKKELKKKKISS